eukprot:1183150-Rhodomonas_salina.1
MTWDLVDVGENWKSIGRYSCYAITILHKDHSDFVGVVQRAISKAGFTAKRLRFDGASEAVCGKLAEFLDSKDIIQEFSNPHEQYGNGISETF